jgi:hypothetical protein
MTTSHSSFVAYLAVRPFQGDASAKQLSFSAGATIMAQPTSQQGGWIWSSIIDPGGVVTMGWSPTSNLSPLYHKGPPPAPSSTGLPFYAEQGNMAWVEPPPAPSSTDIPFVYAEQGNP